MDNLFWKPTRSTRFKIRLEDKKLAFSTFRMSSSAYASRKDVRKFVFERDGSQCAYCLTKENLQIDHIMSVYFCFHNGIFEYCNTLDNLQVLCGSCNSAKLP